MLIEFADVVELRRDQADVQFGVGQAEGILVMEALVIGLMYVARPVHACVCVCVWWKREVERELLKALCD